MNKGLKYILFSAIVVLVLYNSISIGKLSELKAATNQSFDAAAYTKELWTKKIAGKIDSAIELSTLISELAKDQPLALNKYTNSLGIGNYRYVFVKTQVKVIAVEEDEIKVQFKNGNSTTDAIIATEYIYGNAVRDASFLVNVKDFSNTTDLNAISEEMNSIIRKEIIPGFKSSIKKGDSVNLVAAIELNKAFIKWEGLELIPVHLEILP